MDRLQKNDRLRGNEQLVSKNGWFRVAQQSDGNLVPHRVAAGPQGGYWLTQWMDDPSYSRYQASQGLRWPWLPTWWPGNSFRTPAADGYLLEYRINGNQYPAW